MLSGMSDSTTPTDLQIIPLTKDDAQRVDRIEDAAWFMDRAGVDTDTNLAPMDWSRAFGAVRGDDPALAGLFGAYDMQVTVPGPMAALQRVPMEGLSWVAVHPDHRRQGILRRMIARHLQWVHEESPASISGLHASEPGIYGRFGYGNASLDVRLELSRGAELTATEALDEAAAKVRTYFVPADSDEATRQLHASHLAAAEGTLGTVTRPESVARVWFTDIPAWRRDREPLQVLFAERDGRITGHATFARKEDWKDNRPDGTLTVGELTAQDTPSLLALSRRVVDFDLTSTVKIGARSLDDPLVWWADGPRAMKTSVNDSLWIRIVDVDHALTARGYAASCDLVLDVLDDMCPWNARRWRLTTDENGVAMCEPTTDAADIRLPVRALGSAYLGSRSLAAQAMAGQVEELRNGTVAQLSRAMRADVEPVGAVGF